MKTTLFAVLLFVYTHAVSEVYISKTCEISFFSEAPLENIEAKNTAATPVLSTSSGDFQVRIPIKAFKFKNALMEEHFNENYMETDKYEFAIFKGKINEPIDYSKNGTHNVTVTGKFEIHGVTKERTISGTITIKDGIVIVDSKFFIRVADYNIKVPNMYVQNIAEEVEVTVSTSMEPYKKPETKK